MKPAGRTNYSVPAKLFVWGAAVLALGLLFAAWQRGQHYPSSDDASIDADVVHIAPLVGGRVIDIAVVENASVKAGERLLQIDPEPYRLVVAQAQADLQLAQAQLETQRRILSTQRSNANVADQQSRNAKANYELSARTAQRLRPLRDQGYVPVQQVDQAEVAEHDAAVHLRQAQELASAANRAVDTEAAAQALVNARQAALAIAQRALDDTTVLAPHSGWVVGLSVSSGENVLPHQSLFTLINQEEWYAVANFRETELSAITVGDCATVYSMVDRRQAIAGRVQGLGWGVLDQDRINLPRSLPLVERSLNWVRVAQRFPVRIRLENADPQLMRLGATAVVEVKHGAECH